MAHSGILKRLFLKTGNGPLLQEAIASLKSNGGITYDGDGQGLYVDWSRMDTSALSELLKSILKAGGGLAVDGDGNLYVDFSSMTAEQLRDLLSLLIQDGGGLAYDENGQLYVDFDSMDPQRFEDMLKALTIPIFLTGNKPFYVNGATGSDDTSKEGIGESTDVPFKTIQACATYVATYYNMNTRHATIYVASGTYDETLSLGGFSATTGYIEIRPLDGDYTVTVSNTTTGHLVNVASGGSWRIHNMNLSLTALPGTSSGNNFHSVVYVGVDGTVRLYDCAITVRDASGTKAGTDAVQALWTYGGSLDLYHGSGNARSLALTANGYADSYYAFCVSNCGKFRFHGDDDSQTNANYSVSGAYTTVVSCVGSSLFTFDTNSKYDPQLVVPSGSSCTGRRYRATTGGGISTGGAGEEYIPGDTAGSVEAASYSWYV